MCVCKRTCLVEFPDESFSCCIVETALRAHKTTHRQRAKRKEMKINRSEVGKMEEKKKMDYYLQIEGADIQFIILGAQVSLERMR